MKTNINKKSGILYDLYTRLFLDYNVKSKEEINKFNILYSASSNIDIFSHRL